VGGEADDFHAVGKGAGDLEGGGADGAGGAEEEDAFFERRHVFFGQDLQDCRINGIATLCFPSVG
jgi:hypothetical protein